MARPARASAATLRAPRNSIISTLIEPLRAGLSPLRAARVVDRGALVRAGPRRSSLQPVDSSARRRRARAARLVAEHAPSFSQLLRGASTRGARRAGRRECRSAAATRSASEAKVALVEPTSTMRSVFACSTTSTFAVLPRPVRRPSSGSCAYLLGEERRLVRAEGARPADELVGREREHEHGRRRPGGVDALDLRPDALTHQEQQDQDSAHVRKPAKMSRRSGV